MRRIPVALNLLNFQVFPNDFLENHFDWTPTMVSNTLSFTNNAQNVHFKNDFADDINEDTQFVK